MNSTVDFTPVILAQLTDLQMRITKQDAVISALKAEIERISGTTIRDTITTSVPLRQHDMHIHNVHGVTKFSKPIRTASGAGTSTPLVPSSVIRTRPQVAPEKSAHPNMKLSDILNIGEEVTIQIGTGKDSDGNFSHTTAIATFDGTDLNVIHCELATGLIGMKSSKPGEILYKFIDELKSNGHIKKTFTIAPWKLCFVERKGVRHSLEQLRTMIVA